MDFNLKHNCISKLKTIVKYLINKTMDVINNMLKNQMKTLTTAEGALLKEKLN